MGQSLLFKWEDSPALKHHCGFCERPLSHPGAKSSCFGKHSEPCARFHQAMFMRLRGHTCQYCLSIDEAHHKRHQGIAERLRALYESCGEVDWNIIPSESDTAARGRGGDFDHTAGLGFQTESRIVCVDTMPSKRERKDAKRLARAANRPKVVGLDEIQYVDSVIHSADGITSNDTDGPRNAEELEEIEKQLRYHAHIYNTRGSREGLKKLADVPSDTPGVDFDAEMDRILDVFRITELLKRNTNTKGLQGKELRRFLNLVNGFKRVVVEDIVLVKKDIAEVRMRRAGYLRYINRSSYDILEDRYSDKNWKTGEKFIPEPSDSSSVKTPEEETELLSSGQQEEQSPMSPCAGDGPDRRHLETMHQHVDDNGLSKEQIEPYYTPLLPMLPNRTPGRGPISLRLVDTKNPERATYLTSFSGKQKAIPSTSDSWSIVTNGSSPRIHVPKLRVWGNIPARHTDIPKTLDQPSIERNSSDDPTVMAPAVKSLLVYTVKEPESFLAGQEETATSHLAVSHKKKSKKLREAKRKAKKNLDSEESTGGLIADGGPTDQASGAINASLSDDLMEMGSGNQTSEITPDDGAPLSQGEADFGNEAFTTAESSKEYLEDASVTPPSLVPVTSYGKHIHWTNFVRHFTVDQLTNPFLPQWGGSTYASWCAFEKNGVPDCPFHQPHCACADPAADQCYLVMPSDEPCSTGPYNRFRGEKLLAQYEQDDKTKGRLMLVDDDMVEYLMEATSSRAMCLDLGLLPSRLAKEYAEFGGGYEHGPLMEQERRFERLKSRNALIKQKLTYETLREIQCGKIERNDAWCFCYCRTTVPKKPARSLFRDVIACSYQDCSMKYFHKSCTKKLGVDKVSRWYCTSCEKEMQALANQMLRNLGFTDIPDNISCGHSHNSRFDDLGSPVDEQVNRLIRQSTKTLTRLMRPELRQQNRQLEGYATMP